MFGRGGHGVCVRKGRKIGKAATLAGWRKAGDNAGLKTKCGNPLLYNKKPLGQAKKQQYSGH
jgi:hypothetical protein